MNSATRKNTRQRRGNVRRRPRTVRTVALVQPAGGGPRRRVRRRTAGRRTNTVRGPAGRNEVFTFSVNDLKAGSSGILKFGPGLSECPALSNGILKSYHDYKITNVKILYQSHASAQTSGAMFLEVDNSCSQSTLGSYVNSFTISKSGVKQFTAARIHGTDYLSSTVNQFHLLYKGNGSSSEVAGQFIITIRVANINPK